MSTNSDLDLTEFVSKLIQDTFNAITISSKDQAEVYFELKRMAEFDFEVFREKYIHQSDIDKKLSEIFPQENDLEGLHMISAGLPYQYIPDTKEEFPSLQNSLGYTTSESQKNSKSLTSETVFEIYKLVKDLVATQQYSSFQDIMSRGIPRVIIDSGRILAKISLNYTVTENEDSSKSTSDLNAIVSSRNSNAVKIGAEKAIPASNLKEQLLYRNIASKLAKTRVGVTIPDPTNTASSKNNSLWGEIEIKFRAVD